MILKRWLQFALHTCAVFSVLCFLGGRIACAQSDGVTFGEAWQLVKSGSQALQASQAGIEQARNERDGTRDMYLPQINLTGSYLYLDDDVQLSAAQVLDSMPAGAALSQMLAGLAAGMGVSPAQLSAGTTSTISEREVKSSGVTMLWPLYTGGRITAAQGIAEAAVREAELQRELKVRDRFEELSRRYFGVVLAEQIVATRSEVEASLKMHLDHARLLVENGQIAEVERLQAEASFDKARVDRIKSEEDLGIAEAALVSLLGIDSVETVSGLFVNRDIPSLQESLSRTLESFPGLEIFDTKKQMAEGLAKVEEGKYFPEVAALGSYSLYEEDSLASELMPDWFVGLSISLPLLDRSGRGGKYRAAQSLQKKIDALRRQAKQDIGLLVEKTHRDRTQAVAEYDGLGTSLQLARQTVELRTKAFQQGLATSLDVIDASLYVAAVKSQRSHAAYNSVTKLARLLALRGDVDENVFAEELIQGE